MKWRLVLMLLLVAMPARAQTWTCTGNSPANWSCTMAAPTAPPVVASLLQPAPAVDIQKAILDALTQLHQDALASLTVEQSTNAEITKAGLTFGTAMTWLGKYVAPAAVGILTTLKATGKL